MGTYSLLCGNSHSNYQRNEDVVGLAKLTYVAGPDEPCDVSGEVRPPKVVNDVCSCGEVSMMSGDENRWPLVAVDNYFMTTLRMPLPKTFIWKKYSVYCKKVAYAVLVSPRGRSVVLNHSRTHRKWLSARWDLSDWGKRS